MMALMIVGGAKADDIVSSGSVTTNIAFSSITANTGASWNASTGDYTTTTAWSSIQYWISSNNPSATMFNVTIEESADVQLQVYYKDDTNTYIRKTGTNFSLPLDPTKEIQAFHIINTVVGTIKVISASYEIENVQKIDLSQLERYGDADKVTYNTSTYTITPIGENSWVGATKWGAINQYGTKFVVKLSSGTGIATRVRYYKNETEYDVEEDLGNNDGDYIVNDLDATKKIHTLSILDKTSSPISIDYAYIMPTYLSQATTPTLTNGSKAPVFLYRKLKVGWNTICLPFATTVSTIAADAELYEFTAATASTITLTKKDNGEMAANTPYFIKLSVAITDPIEFSDVTISNTGAGTVVNNGLTLHGNYTAAMSMVDKYGVASGAIKKGVTGSTLPAFSAYFDGSFAEAREFSIFTDDETTGISSMQAEPAQMFDNQYYNLNGQRISQPAKGLYIKNGKKYIIK